MTEQPAQTETLPLLWTWGLIVAVGAALALGYGFSTDSTPLIALGWAVCAVASLLLSIAVIATGVRIGVTTTRP